MEYLLSSSRLEISIERVVLWPPSFEKKEKMRYPFGILNKPERNLTSDEE